jgi:hypothetical protein
MLNSLRELVEQIEAAAADRPGVVAEFQLADFRRRVEHGDWLIAPTVDGSAPPDIIDLIDVCRLLHIAVPEFLRIAADVPRKTV